VRQLLDHLGLATCHILGTSMGGVYALATAAVMPGRIKRLTLVSTIAELQTRRSLDGLESDMKSVLAIARRSRPVALALLKLIVRDDPKRYLERRVAKLPVADQHLYQDVAFYQMSVNALRENMRQGLATMFHDFMLLARPWPIDLARVTVPVDCWHGALDITSPIGGVEELANRLPDCRTCFMPDETHMMIYRHWHTIVSLMLSDERPRRDLMSVG
jgi:pimeloyl-ACP methyl ester carboxylesterase